VGAAEKRREKRFKRRLRVVFEADGTRAGGYTTNLSARGMQVTAAVVFPTGSVIRGRIELPDGRELAVDAKVRWAVKTQGTFSIMREKAMGLELLPPVPAELLGLLDGAREEIPRIREGISSVRAASADAGTTSPVRPRPATPPPMVRPRPATPPPAARPRPATPPPTVRPRPATPAVAPPAATPAPPAARAPLPATTPAPRAPVPAAPVPRPPAATPAPPTSAGIAVGRDGIALLQVTKLESLSPTAAMALIEEAATQALLGALPPDQESRGADVTLTIMDTEPLPPGSSVQAHARVSAVSANGRLVDFTLHITELGRPIATGTHTRVIVRRRVG